MKKFVLVLIVSLFLTTSLFAQQTVRVLPKPIQKIEYDNDVSGNSREFFGWAAIDTATSEASWKIMRITYASADATDDFVIEFCDGDALYDNIFDNRASLVYK